MFKNQEKPHLQDFTISQSYSLHRSCYHPSWPYSSMSVIKVGIFFLKVVVGTHWTLLFLHLTLISGIYSSDFAYRLYPSLIVKKFKVEFSQKELERFFFKILDLSSPNIRKKYLLKTKCLDFFSLQATLQIGVFSNHFKNLSN